MLISLPLLFLDQYFKISNILFIKSDILVDEADLPFDIFNMLLFLLDNSPMFGKGALKLSIVLFF